MHNRVLAGLMSLALLALLAAPAAAQDVEKLEDQVTRFTLDNGLTFLVVERHDAPVFTYISMVKVGSVNEVPGITGLAHMFEHMAFKGTDVIGTNDIKEERKAIEAIDAAYRALAEAKREGASEEVLADLQEALEVAQEEAGAFVEANEFGGIIEQAGGTGLNASTQPDVTTYFYSLPSNKLELWAYLESERFERPVMREFYKERDVVMEERRMRTESSPIGRLIEEFLAASYLGHPYGQPTVGHMSDLQAFTRQDALEFYDKYYVPGNTVVALVGDVDPKQVKKLAREYFGDWKAGPVPEPVRTVEPAQRGERRVALKDPGQPFLVVGYHKPDVNHPDDAAWDVLTEMLANGRSSRLHQRLVKEEKRAVAVGALTQIPGQLYPGLFITYAVPAKGVPAGELEAAVLEELEKVKTEGVPQSELDAVRTRMKANWTRQMRSNRGIGLTVVGTEIMQGDYRKAFQYPSELDAVTPADLQRIARDAFTETNRTVGLIITEEEGADDAS